MPDACKTNVKVRLCNAAERELWPQEAFTMMCGEASTHAALRLEGQLIWLQQRWALASQYQKLPDEACMKEIFLLREVRFKFDGQNSHSFWMSLGLFGIRI